MNEQSFSEIIAEIKAAKEIMEKRGEKPNTITPSVRMRKHSRWNEIKAYFESIGLKQK